MKKTLCTLLAVAMILGTAVMVPTSAISKNASSVSAGQNQVETPLIKNIENTADGVKLSWVKVTGAYKYRVYYKGKNGWTKFAETTGTTAVDDVVTSGSTYTYTIRCVDENGKFISGYNANGWKHKFVSVAPRITNIENTENGVKLSWGKVAGVYKYRVYYKGKNGWTKFAETKGTTALDDVVSSGKTYTYTVRGLDKNNNFVSGYNKDGWKQTWIAAPKVIKTESTLKGIKIIWDMVNGADKYRVFYKNGSSWKRLTTTSSTSYEDTSVACGDKRTYTIRCVDSKENYAGGYNSKGWTHKFVSTPFINNITAVNNGIKISWHGVYGADKYRLYVKSNNSSWKKIAETTSETYIDTNVKAGSTYTYTLRCVSSDGKYFTSSYDTAGKSYAYKVNNSTRDAFVNYLMNNQSTWLPMKLTGMAAQAGFEFADLDFDGINELIVQQAGGTMCNYDATVYSYINGNIVKANYSENFIQNRLKYYYNKNTKKYEIHGTAIAAAGLMNDHTFFNFKLNLKNNKITTNYYSVYSDIYPQNTKSGKHEYHYYNGANGYYLNDMSLVKEITKTEYDLINNAQLRYCIDANKRTQFVYRNNWDNYTTSQKRQAILDSYNAFAYDKY